MNKKTVTVLFSLLMAFALFIGCSFTAKTATNSKYRIHYEGGGAKPAALLLSSYLENISEENRSFDLILLKKEKDDEAFHNVKITPASITFTANTEGEMIEAVNAFANAYLGFQFAGTDRQSLNSSNVKDIRIPQEVECDNPWMDKREPIITLWKTNTPRGAYKNENSSLLVDVMSYTDEELYSYVRMMKHLGFTGIQVTDMCAAWAGEGGIEPVHNKIRFMADAAHSMDMDFTLWVWGAEFTGYGWVDNSVTYEVGEYGAARNNPTVRACFEKYYNYYAELADVSDRVIAHFYDPGHLNDANDVAYFAGMLRDRFKAVNPSVDFGVSCWVDKFDKNTLVANLGTDITLYEGMQHNAEENYAPFRQMVNNLGCRLGMWEWNGCEMEIDQMAQMNYQPSILKENTQALKANDGVKKAEYWSTMDSYHVLNVFSLYAAARLEQNPDADINELTSEISRLAVGEKYADDFAQMLLLLEDARSGHTWNEFFWDSSDYIVKSGKYPYEDIIKKYKKLSPILDKMIEENIEANELPLPIPLTDVLKLFKSHLDQIYKYATFRQEFDKFKENYDKGKTDQTWVNDQLIKLSTPIPDYDAVIGLWGQIEARIQRELIVKWCENHGMVPVKVDALDKVRKEIMSSFFKMRQKGQGYPVHTQFPYFEYGAAFNEYDTYRLIDEMVAEGTLIKDNGVYLANYEEFE